MLLVSACRTGRNNHASAYNRPRQQNLHPAAIRTDRNQLDFINLNDCTTASSRPQSVIERRRNNIQYPRTPAEVPSPQGAQASKTDQSVSYAR